MEVNSINAIVQHAYDHVEYYKEKYSSLGIDTKEIKTQQDIELLPFVSKNIVQGRHDSFVSDIHQKYPKSEMIEVRRTSGSTGKYLKIFWDRKDNIKSLIPLWLLRKKYHGITPNMKWVSFYSVCYDGNKIVNLVDKELDSNGKHLGFSKIGLTYERIRAIYNDILEFSPEWMLLQPSIAYCIAEVIKNEKLPLPKELKYIELNGEYVFDSQRKAIEDVFGIKTVNMYGCNEVNGIAYELPDGKFHIISDNVVVEVIKDGKSVLDEEGDIYVTSLRNSAMPFIRYETGDRGILRETETNGKKEQILELCSGRSSDYVLLENGEKLNSYVISNIVEYTNENMSTVIKQFRVVQTSVNKFEVEFVIRSDYSGWKDAVIESFMDNISEPSLKNAEWSFTWKDEIYPDPNTGKYKFFENKVKQ